MTQIIGGKLDGTRAACRLPQFTQGGETYILIQFDNKVGDKKVKHFFYMLTNGPTVKEAQEIYRQRLGI